MAVGAVASNSGFANVSKPINTRQEVANEANVSGEQIRKVKKILEKAPEDVKEKVLKQ